MGAVNAQEAMPRIIRRAIDASLPEAAVRAALAELPQESERLIVIAVGKAAWRMANAAREDLGPRVQGGVVITKYGHSPGPIDGLRIFEAGHPVPDANSFSATREAMNAVRGLSAEDQVLFLLSGGGSALFESPLIEPDELAGITRQLLACGAEVTVCLTLDTLDSGSEVFGAERRTARTPWPCGGRCAGRKRAWR